MNPRLVLLGRLLSLALVTATLCEIGARRYAIGIDGQEVRCLPWRVFLIDRARVLPRRLTFVAFRARGLAPRIADGTLLVKQVIGMPGDVVQVRDGRYRINGVDRGRIDPAVRGGAGAASGAEGRAQVLGDGEYAVLGTHPASFDSRYFGPVTAAQVVGEARPLW